MRVTDSMRMSALLDSQASSTETLFKATQQASSGLKVQAPADDPAAFARIASHDGVIARLGSREQALTRSQGDLSIAESTLASATDLMAQAKELAVELADGTVNASQRADAANQVTAMRQTLAGLANTRGATGYVFAGTNTNTAPIAANGTFTGNDNAINTETADGIQMRTNASGAKAFTAAGGRDLMQDLSDFATALTNNDIPGIQGMIQKLTDGQNQVISARGETGIALDRITTASSITSTVTTAVKASRAPDSDVDATSAYSNLSAANDAYSRAIAVTQSMLQTFSAEKMS